MQQQPQQKAVPVPLLTTRAGLMLKALETLLDGSSLAEEDLLDLHDAVAECEGLPAVHLPCARLPRMPKGTDRMTHAPKGAA